MQWRIHRDWNNAKCHALSLNALSTWSEPDAIFVTKDGDFDKEKLKEPIALERQVLTPPPRTPWPSEEPIALIEQKQTIRLFGVIQGQIMTPQKAEKYQWKRLEEERPLIILTNQRVRLLQPYGLVNLLRLHPGLCLNQRDINLQWECGSAHSGSGCSEES
jgi:hypothetical protein